jgi:hypothetical protein
MWFALSVLWRLAAVLAEDVNYTLHEKGNTWSTAFYTSVLPVSLRAS